MKTPARAPSQATAKPLRFMALFLFVLVLGFNSHEAKAQTVVFDATQATNMATQFGYFVQQQLQNAAHAVTDLLGKQAALSGAAMIGDAQITQMNIESRNQVTVPINLKYALPSKANICPIVMTRKLANSAHDAKSAIRLALTQLINFVGAGGNDPTVATKQLATLCSMGLEKTSLMQNCSQSTAYSSGVVWTPNAVVYNVNDGSGGTTSTSVLQYPIPTNISFNANTGMPSFAAPADADKPALAAIFYCALRHPPTGKPVDPNATVSAAAAPQKAFEYIQQRRATATANAPDSTCLDALADRIQVPASASTQMLQQVHDVQAMWCTQALAAGTISAAQNTDCQQNGVSTLQMQKYEACPDQNSITTDINNNATTGDNAASRELEKSSNCARFRDNLDARNRQFVQVMSAPTAAVPEINPNTLNK